MGGLKTVVLLFVLPTLILAISDAEIYYQLVTLNNNIQNLNEYVKNLGESINQTTIDVKPDFLMALDTFNQYLPNVANNFDKIVTDYVPTVSDDIDKISNKLLPTILYYDKNLYKVIFSISSIFGLTLAVITIISLISYKIINHILYKIFSHKKTIPSLLPQINDEL